MKNNLFILACFLSIILMNAIPIGTETVSSGEILYTNTVWLLPNILLFSCIGLAITILIVLATINNLNTNLEGQFTIKRKDYNLKTLYINMLIWALLILILKMVIGKTITLFQWADTYFFITLCIVLAFYIFLRYYIRKTNPDFISLNKQTLRIRHFFTSGERNLAELTSVDYNPNSNSIKLIFKEGLKNISFSLVDYEINDMLKLIEEIRKNCGPAIKINDTFKNTFYTSHE